MKKHQIYIPIFALILLASQASIPAQTNSSRFFGRFGRLLIQLKSVKAISNYDHGWGSTNEFYLLSKDFLRDGTAADFKAMTAEGNPVIRAMGLLCLAQTDVQGKYYLMLLSSTRDPQQVYFTEGCVIGHITVGEFAKMLLNNPFCLEEGGKPPAQ